MLIEKRASTSRVTGEIGSDALITYTLIVTNVGGTANPAVVVTDASASGLAYVEGSALPLPNQTSPMVWRLGTLLPGENRVILFVARLAIGTQSVVHNVAVVGNQIEAIVASDEAVNTLDPTVITLEALSAKQGADGVQIYWRTSMEQNTFGFRIYRSNTSNLADASAISANMLPAYGRNGRAEYTTLDQQPINSANTYYWLNEIETTGSSLFYGPIHLTGMEQSLVWQTYIVYLPMLVR